MQNNPYVSLFVMGCQPRKIISCLAGRPYFYSTYYQFKSRLVMISLGNFCRQKVGQPCYCQLLYINLSHLPIFCSLLSTFFRILFCFPPLRFVLVLPLIELSRYLDLSNTTSILVQLLEKRETMYLLHTLLPECFGLRAICQ